jgi:hypothetical protein
MTNEELDKARAKEAWRKCEALGFGKDYESPTIIAARLAREGWTPPPPPVDPDLLAVREIVAKVFDEKGWLDHSTIVHAVKAHEARMQEADQ